MEPNMRTSRESDVLVPNIIEKALMSLGWRRRVQKVNVAK